MIISHSFVCVNVRKIDDKCRLVFDVVGKQFSKLEKYWGVYDDVIETLSNGFNDASVAVEASKKAFAQSGLTKAVYEYITSIGVSSAAEMTFAQKLKLSAIALKEQAAAWAATPMGIATIAAAGIFGIVKLVDLFTVSLDESREKLAELKEEYNENESELSTLNGELQTTVDRINELEGKDSLTFTEAEELQNLKEQNAELERTIALLEKAQEIKQKELRKSFIETMEKDVDKMGEYAQFGSYTSAAYVPQYGTSRGQKGTYITERDYINSMLKRREEIINSLAGELTDKEREKLEGYLDYIDEFLIDKSTEYSKAAEGIEYVSSPTTDDEKAANEWLDFINDFQDKIAIAMNVDGAKENAVNRLIFGEFSEATKELQELGEQGAVTAEHLADPKYDGFIDKCIELGIISDDGTASLSLFAIITSSWYC